MKLDILNDRYEANRKSEFPLPNDIFAAVFNLTVEPNNKTRLEALALSRRATTETDDRGNALARPSKVRPRALFPALDTSPNAGLQFLDSYTPLDENFGAFPDLGMLPDSSMDLGISPSLDCNNLFHDMFTGFSDPGPPSAVGGLFGAPPTVPQAAPAPAPILSSAIDPQLFTAPIPAPAPVPTLAPLSAPRATTVDYDDDNSDEDYVAYEEDDEIAPLLITSSTRLGAGRRPRNHAAATGGISKRPSRAGIPSSVVPSYVHFDDPKAVIPLTLGGGGVVSYLNGERIGSQEPDEWHSTPEEYEKLSSKEKRQLWHKISARNFR
ncbi:hypothetical protein FRC09_016140 [Ceratobasidium sp. 395]|nr:hypothetical protein FRC09_016140 [Ceratobasidium sp. 395]